MKVFASNAQMSWAQCSVLSLSRSPHYVFFVASEKEDDEVLAEPSDHPLLLDNGVLSDPPDEEQEVEAEENNEQEAKFYPTSDEDGLYELAYEITNSAINQQNENIDEEEELEFELQVEEKASSTADTQEERIQIPVQQTG